MLLWRELCSTLQDVISVDSRPLRNPLAHYRSQFFALIQVHDYLGADKNFLLSRAILAHGNELRNREILAAIRQN